MEYHENQQKDHRYQIVFWVVLNLQDNIFCGLDISLKFLIFFI
jgi:hypothetical protein